MPIAVISGSRPPRPFLLTCTWDCAVSCSEMAWVFNFSASNRSFRPFIFWLRNVSLGLPRDLRSDWSWTLLSPLPRDALFCFDGPGSRTPFDVSAVATVGSEMMLPPPTNGSPPPCSRYSGLSIFSPHAAVSAAMLGWGANASSPPCNFCFPASSPMTLDSRLRIMSRVLLPPPPPPPPPPARKWKYHRYNVARWCHFTNGRECRLQFPIKIPRNYTIIICIINKLMF